MVTSATALAGSLASLAARLDDRAREMRAGLGEGDTSSRMPGAHTLTGGAATLCVRAVAETIRQLQAAAGEGRVDRCHALLSELEAEVTRTHLAFGGMAAAEPASAVT